MDTFVFQSGNASLDDVLIFPVGSFVRDGIQRSFTPEQAAAMVTNFKNGVLGRKVPVNREHDKVSGRVAHVTDLWLADEGVRGKITEVPGNEGALGAFDYLSPEVVWDWEAPDTGESHKNMLVGLAATNYPFFGGKMALNSDSTIQIWNGSDWRYGRLERKDKQTEVIMTEPTQDERLAEILTKLAGMDGLAGDVETLKGLLAERQEPETASDAQAEAYTEQIKSLEEKYAEAETKRAQLAEAFAASERARKLITWTDTVQAFSIGEPEKFAEDMLEIETINPDLAGRMVARFKAAQEQIKAGDLFSQHSKAGDSGDASKHPFENEVEKMRLERFASLSYAEGYTQALQAVGSEKPELARQYVRRGG